MCAFVNPPQSLSFVPWVAQSRMEVVSVGARCGGRMKARGSGFPQAEDLGSGLPIWRRGRRVFG